MNERHSGAIVILLAMAVCLLAAILSVMLYGASALFTFMDWGIAALGLLVIACAAVYFLIMTTPMIPAALKGWALLLIAPVAAPIGRWHALSQRKTRGEEIGLGKLGINVLGTFFFAIFCWALAAIPLFVIVLALKHQLS